MPTSGQTVVVRFRPSIGLPYDDNVGVNLAAPWTSLAGNFPGIAIRRRIRSIDASRLHVLAGSPAVAGASGAVRLLRTFEVRCPPGIDANHVASELRGWANIESAYVQPGLKVAVAVGFANNPSFADQGYLSPAPEGLNALCAWQLAGGDGSGRSLVDIERGWSLGHRDLPGAVNSTLIYGWNSGDPGDTDHGLMTLGVICAADNSYECVGFAPAIQSVRLASVVGPDADHDLENAIAAAIVTLSGTAGGVILLEVELDADAFAPNGCVDLLPAVRHAIKTAVDSGIAVVEAAGNGACDLDVQRDADGLLALKPGTPDYDDSGAILVGAASASAPHTSIKRSWQGNFGGRVDCYAWGEGVKTLYGTDVTTDFEGTSSASAVVAGAVVLLQGLAEKQLGAVFDPWTLRDHLRLPENGTESIDPPTDRIGVMPDLAKLIRNHVTTAVPEVYARDFAGDDGSVGPTTVVLSMSPDIIVRRSAVVDPQAEFGEGSGHEDDTALSEEVVAKTPHSIYVRVRNRGGADAVNIQARVSWAEPTTLLLPDFWNEIGTIVIPSVPAGDVLTVSPELAWAAADVPASGHYCFIAEVLDPFSPSPAKAAILDIGAFYQFIRTDNNVVWRNFNVVEYAAAGTAIPLGAWVPAPESGRSDRMQVVVEAALPPGATVELKASRDWLQRIERFPRGDDPAPAGERRIAPHGRTLVASGIFPPGSRGRVELTVRMPAQKVPRAGVITLRQSSERGDLGRVTWRLVPKRHPRR